MSSIRIEANGESFGPFDSWPEAALEIRRLQRRGVHDLRLVRQHYVCDFCADPAPTWEYAAADTPLARLGDTEHMSSGAWTACQACHDLIEAHDDEGLLRRAYDTFQRMHGDLGVQSSLVTTMLNSVHEGFRSSRLPMPATPIPTDEDLLKPR